MRWSIEDSPERAAFRSDVRGWLHRTLVPGWMEAIDGGDEDSYRTVRTSAEASGWNVLAMLVLLEAAVLFHLPALSDGIIPIEDDVKVFYFPLLVAASAPRCRDLRSGRDLEHFRLRVREPERQVRFRGRRRQQRRPAR